MTTKKASEAATEPCTNCSEPAIYRTKNPGAEVAHYCEACAERTYPGEVDLYMVAVDAA